MKRMTANKWVALAVVAALGMPALASDSNKKESYHCKAETQACLNEMVSKLKNRGWVGVELDDSKAPAELTVTRIVPGGPAEAAGLQVGDVLVALNGVRFDSTADAEKLDKTRQGMVPGSTIEYTLLRKGAEKKVTVKLGELPSDVLAQWVGMHMVEHHAKSEVAKK